MSDFADYVENQQKARQPLNGKAKAGPKAPQYEEHAELDILDSLDLAETSNLVPLRDLLLGNGGDGDEALRQLGDELQKRMLEGHGETLFDLGQEDNGETMKFSKEQWDISLDRIRRAARALKADCQVLMTRNVGGDEDVESTNEKDKSCTGKVMIRQEPDTPEEVIETRIAVVGNGKSHTSIAGFVLLIHAASRCWEEYLAWCSCQGRSRRRPRKDACELISA